MKVGNVDVEINGTFVITHFDDDRFVLADIDEQPGQAETAAAHGLTVKEMNLTHDLTHSLLAKWLGLPYSPTLRGVATRDIYPHHAEEEAAVLAIQRFARLAGVSLLGLARGEKPHLAPARRKGYGDAG
jgi:hypothetical protein